MSFQMLALVQTSYPGESMAEFLLAVMLAECADHDGTSIFPAVETMAEFGRQTVRTAQRGLRAMLDSGWLQLVTPATNRRPAEYRINPEWIRAAYGAIAAAKAVKRKRRRVPVAFPNVGENRGDTATPQESATFRGDTETPQPAAPGATLTTARGDIHAGAYKSDPSLTLPPTPKGGHTGFDRLLAAYPKHRRNLRAARREWIKRSPDDALLALMVAAAKQQARSKAWQEQEGKHVPNLSKWLADEGWKATHDDAIEAPAAQTAVIKDAARAELELSEEEREAQRQRAADARARLREIATASKRGMATA